MEPEADKTETDDAAARLIAAGRALLARGDARFPLTRLCAEAGVSLGDFRRSFASKAALLQQLMQTSKPEPAPQIVMPATDAWLERRLRVFERALGSLEEKAEKCDRENHLAIARLEEKLATLSGAPAAAAESLAPKAQTAAPQEAAPVRDEPEPRPEDATTTSEPQSESKSDVLILAPFEPAPLPKVDTEFLEAARQAALAHGRALEQKPPRRVSPRLLVIAVLAAFTLAVCAGLTLVHAVTAPSLAAEGTLHRRVATTALEQLMARADSGDAKAQRALALAYLRGSGVKRDEVAAARWSQAAALRGDVPAMHSLAVAYAMGQGIARDETLAAAWFARAAASGYVDSAFDLAVLYERGEGVRQDARLALRWYRVAAAAGDAQAASRARILQEQVHL